MTLIERLKGKQQRPDADVPGLRVQHVAYFRASAGELKKALKGNQDAEELLKSIQDLPDGQEVSVEREKLEKLLQASNPVKHEDSTNLDEESEN